MSYTPEQIAAAHELPLRKDVRWIDMSFMFPGTIIEEMKREPGDEASGKWAAVNMGAPGVPDTYAATVAALTVAAHNEWLAAQPAAAAAGEPGEDDAINS